MMNRRIGRKHGKNVMCCSFRNGNFLTLMINDQWNKYLQPLCLCNGEVRLDGEGVAKRVACRNLLELHEDKGIPLVPLPDRLPPCDREWRGFTGRGGGGRREERVIHNVRGCVGWMDCKCGGRAVDGVWCGRECQHKAGGVEGFGMPWGSSWALGWFWGGW
jgi:hypothetical protein